MKTARSVMTMRCDIERNVQTGTDAYNNPLFEWQTVGVDVPCRFWFEAGTGSRTQENDGSTITLHAIKGIVQKDLDLAGTDRITEVRDRRGNTVFGALKLDSVELRADHQSVIAENYE